MLPTLKVWLVLYDVDPPIWQAMHSAKEWWMEAGFHKAGQSTKPMASLVMLVSMGDMEGEKCPVFFQNQSTIVTMLVAKIKEEADVVSRRGKSHEL
jgi:hypothetical protein